MTIYKGNIIHTPSPEKFEMYEGGYIVVDGNGFIEGVYQALPIGLSDEDVVDFGNRLLIPAMNDLHVHAPQYGNMGIVMDMELIPWLNTYTFPEESQFADEQYAQRVYQSFVEELCRQGTMRASIFATIHLSATCALAKIIHEKGMGAMVGLVGMDRHSPADLKNTAHTWRDDMQSLMCKLSDYPLVKTIITPRFIPSCSAEMLQVMGDYAKSYALPVQSHLSENKKEIEWVKQLEPQSSCYGDAYYTYGLFGQTPTLMAHCCYTDGEEMRLMSQQKVMAVHCPTSNCNLSSGIAPVRRFIQAGIPVALGTDIAGGHHLSIFRVMQYAIQMSKLQYAMTNEELPFLTLSEVFYMATKSGGSFFGKVGSFEVGYAFDALVIDDASINTFPFTTNLSLQHRLERFVFLGDDRHITHRFCQGKEICFSKL